MAVFDSFYTWVSRSFRLTDGGLPSSGGTSENYSGKCVTVDTALTLSSVWGCVRLLAESIASLPLGLFYKDADGNREEARQHPLYGILHNKPNADMTAFEFWECVIGCMVLWGNSYSLKNMSGNRLVGLTPLRPDWMRAKINLKGEITYIYSAPTGQKIYTEDDLFHLKNFGLSGRLGLSTIAFARNSMGNAMATEESAGRLFSNGMRAGGALSIDKVLKADERAAIRTSIADQVGGVAKTGGIMVLEAGMKYDQLTIPPEDAQMLQTRGFQVEDICRWFRCPPQLIGHTEKSTTWGTGLEEIKLGFLEFTLMPYLIRIEQVINTRLLSPVDRLKYFSEFNFEGFLRANTQMRAQYFSTAAQNGWMSRNEIRRKENLKNIDGADALTVQSNLVPIDLLGADSGGAKARDALKQWLAQTETVEPAA